MILPALSNRISRDIARQVTLSAAIARTQIEISGGRKLLQASDDPVASARVAAIERSQSNSKTWQAVLARGIALADQADGVAASVGDRMAQARTLVVAGASATASPTDRATLASELRGIAAELDGLARTSDSEGNPLFRSGEALSFRFSDHDVFAPVLTAQQLFEASGTPVSDMVRAAATALETGSESAIETALGALAGAIAGVADARGEIGVRATRMEALRERHIDEGIGMAAERSSLEDTDIGEAIARLNQQTITLDAARAVFARINQKSLFDLI